MTPSIIIICKRVFRIRVINTIRTLRIAFIVDGWVIRVDKQSSGMTGGISRVNQPIPITIIYKIRTLGIAFIVDGWIIRIYEQSSGMTGGIVFGNSAASIVINIVGAFG